MYAIISQPYLKFNSCTTAKKTGIKKFKAFRNSTKANRPPMKKALLNKIKTTNKVYTIQAKGGFRCVWVTKLFDSNKETFLKLFSDKIRADEKSISQLNIQCIYPRRSSPNKNKCIR